MTYPNEQLPAGRLLKKAPAHTATTQADAIWRESWGLAIPRLVGPKQSQETPTLKRSNAFPVVAEECRAVRETVGLLDITGFSRYVVTGANAAIWLNNLTACPDPLTYRPRLASMLTPSGRLEGELTLFNWGDGTW